MATVFKCDNCGAILEEAGPRQAIYRLTLPGGGMAGLSNREDLCDKCCSAVTMALTQRRDEQNTREA